MRAEKKKIYQSKYETKKNVEPLYNISIKLIFAFSYFKDVIATLNKLL